MKKNIFEELKDRGVCYAVGVAVESFINEDLGMCDKDYHIIAAKQDINKLIKLQFKNKAESQFNTICRKLNYEEISIFKRNQCDFVKVVHNKEGRVFELKGNSFKNYHKSLN